MKGSLVRGQSIVFKWSQDTKRTQFIIHKYVSAKQNMSVSLFIYIYIINKYITTRYYIEYITLNGKNLKC